MTYKIAFPYDSATVDRAAALCSQMSSDDRLIGCRFVGLMRAKSADTRSNAAPVQADTEPHGLTSSVRDSCLL